MRHDDGPDGHFGRGHPIITDCRRLIHHGQEKAKKNAADVNIDE